MLLRAKGALTAAGSGEEVVPASDYRALQSQVRELQRLLGKEAMSFLATTSGVSGEDVRDLMLAAVEHRFGLVNRLPVTIEWLSDNGSCYVAGETRSFARDIGLEPRTTPIESPQSNGMAEAFVRTIKRDYVHVSPCPDAQTVMHQLSAWVNHYNEVHPHKALGYRSPREFIAAHGSS